MVMAPAPTVQRLGRYQVIRHLASGGMAEIYLAQGIGEQVVIKVISADRAQDQKFIQMFLDEARLASTLHHPNIAQMLEVGRQGETYYFAMEYVEGETARALLERAASRRARIPLAVCLKIVAAVAAGLHHAHERKGGTGTQLQIVHRDVTPSNIMLGLDGSVKLLDFGIAQAEGRAAETQSGTIKGKFAYMSPEQCRGKLVDRRTDVFALGIVLYELTTQRRAFRSDTDFDTMDRIVHGRLVKPTAIDAGYPRELEDILMHALATEADDRFATAAEFGRALEAFAARHGAVATPADLTACLAALFGAADGEPRAAGEGTVSDVELQITPGVADALDASTTQDDSADDTALTKRRIRGPAEAAIAASAAAEAFPPQLTGPMPVMSTARISGSLDAAVPSAVPAPGPIPAPARTIMGYELGARPTPSTTHPPVPLSLLDSGRRPALVPSAAAPAASAAPVAPAASVASGPALAAAVIGFGVESTRVTRRHRRGLALAIAAIVVAALAIAAVLLLGADQAVEHAPAAVPTSR